MSSVEAQLAHWLLPVCKAYFEFPAFRIVRSFAGLIRGGTEENSVVKILQVAPFVVKCPHQIDRYFDLTNRLKMLRLPFPRSRNPLTQKAPILMECAYLLGERLHHRVRNFKQVEKRSLLR